MNRKLGASIVVALVLAAACGGDDGNGSTDTTGTSGRSGSSGSSSSSASTTAAPTPGRVPNALGLTFDAASQAMKAAGVADIVPDWRWVADRGEKDRIVAQAPPAEQTFDVTAPPQVVLTVGFVRVMPDGLLGECAMEAHATLLTEAGIPVSAVDITPGKQGRVTSTSPRAGEEILAGEQIQLRTSYPQHSSPCGSPTLDNPIYLRPNSNNPDDCCPFK